VRPTGGVGEANAVQAQRRAACGRALSVSGIDGQRRTNPIGSKNRRHDCRTVSTRAADIVLSSAMNTAPSSELRSQFGGIDIYLFDQLLRGRFDGNGGMDAIIC
jgi:hypothetical protein